MAGPAAATLDHGGTLESRRCTAEQQIGGAWNLDCKEHHVSRDYRPADFPVTERGFCFKSLLFWSLLLKDSPIDPEERA